MVEKCGDDLVAARRFMNLCHSHMSDMFSGGQLPLDDVVNRLAEIQDHAKLMHARSIYKSAQSVIDNLMGRQSEAECASSVMVLQRLIAQYDHGLSEIAPPSTRYFKTAKTNPVGPEIVSDLTRQIETAKTLAPLIKFAEAEDRPALVKLVGLAANQGKSNPARRRDAFENILPALTNHWLRNARSQGKSISVSSGVDACLVTVDLLDNIQSVLSDLGSLVISDVVGTPEDREQMGLRRSAHLAVTGRMEGQTMSVLLSCQGEIIDDDVLDGISEQIRALNLTPYLDLSNDMIRFEIRDIPARRAPDVGVGREEAS